MQQSLGVSFLVIEHNIDVVTSICQRVGRPSTRGKKLVEGLPQDIIADERVREAYLGG